MGVVGAPFDSAMVEAFWARVREKSPNIPRARNYAALRRRADVIELAGASVRIASVEDLIGMKRAAGRPQDQIDVESLEIARSRLRGKRR
jgi:hypothetical protein